MQRSSRTEQKRGLPLARLDDVWLARPIASVYMPLALTLPVSACVASSRMEGIDRRLPEAKRALDIDATIELAHRGGALPPAAGPRASLTYCSSHR